MLRPLKVRNLGNSLFTFISRLILLHSIKISIDQQNKASQSPLLSLLPLFAAHQSALCWIIPDSCAESFWLGLPSDLAT